MKDTVKHCDSFMAISLCLVMLVIFPATSLANAFDDEKIRSYLLGCMQEKTARNVGVQPPPLGQIRDLDAELRRRLTAIPYQEIGRYPLLSLWYSKLITSLINAVAPNSRLGFSYSDLRIIEPREWDSSKDLESTALYSPQTGYIFMRIDSQEFNHSRFERVTQLYALTHEVFHKAIPFGEQKAHHLQTLEEGYVDKLAMQTIHTWLLPEIMSEAEISLSKTAHESYPELDSIPTEPGDFIAVLDTEGYTYLGASRIPNIRIVEYLEKTNPTEFKMLELAFMRGTTREIESILVEGWGIGVARTITNVNLSPEEIFARLATSMEE